jgi:hypothetical protein
MQNKYTILIICAILAYNRSIAQLTIGNGYYTLQISGSGSAYFKGRIYKPDQTKSNNLFEMRNARLDFKGWMGKVSYFELEFDVAQLFARVSDNDNPALVESVFGFRIPKSGTDIRLGYGKVCYSRSNLVSFTRSPFVQRPFITNGNSFSRRDVGITISQSLWKQLINISVGMYSGQGESILKGSNDINGKFEYVAG